MKITDYESVQALTAANVFPLDGPDGTKNVAADVLAKLLLGLMEPDDIMAVIKGELAPEMHRNIFRGKNLGNTVTATQLSNIRNGSFKDLYVGDYWVINSVTWRIVDINYWMRCGDTDFNKPHLVIMPDTSLYTAAMNDTNITTGGYVNSVMYTTNLNDAKTAVAAAFGDAVLTHREYLTNAVSNGYPSAGAWYDSTVELPNECMMYGSHIFTAGGDGSFVPTRYTINKSQLALFKLVPKFIHNRQYFWLRDVVSASSFAAVYNTGTASFLHASYSLGVRVVFAIG